MSNPWHDRSAADVILYSRTEAAYYWDKYSPYLDSFFDDGSMAVEAKNPRKKPKFDWRIPNKRNEWFVLYSSFVLIELYLLECENQILTYRKSIKDQLILELFFSTLLMNFVDGRRREIRKYAKRMKDLLLDGLKTNTIAARYGLSVSEVNYALKSLSNPDTNYLTYLSASN